MKNTVSNYRFVTSFKSRDLSEMIPNHLARSEASALKDETVQFHMERNSDVLESLTREEVRQHDLSKRLVGLVECTRQAGVDLEADEVKVSVLNRSRSEFLQTLDTTKVCVCICI